MKTVAAVVLFVSAAVALGQQATESPTIPPPVKNHHILLTPASAPGTGEPFWIAVAPDGQLAILPVSQLQAKMGAGYRPYTFGELQDALAMLVNRNAELEAEVKQQRASKIPLTPPTQPSAPTQQSAAATQAEAAQAEAQRRQQQKQAALMFLLGRQQPYQLPMPTPPNKGVNCTTTYIGSTAYTNC